MIYEEDIMKLKYYLTEYTKHFDVDDISRFIYSYLGHTEVDSKLKQSMRKYDVLLEEVRPIMKKYFTEVTGEEKRYIGPKDMTLFITVSALENGIADLLKSGLEAATVTHIVSIYLRTGNFNVIPDTMVRESFSNIGVQLMKEAMHLMKTYKVSELVAKVEDSLKPKKAAGTVVTSAVKVDKVYEDAIYNAESEEKINVKK